MPHYCATLSDSKQYKIIHELFLAAETGRITFDRIKRSCSSVWGSKITNSITHFIAELRIEKSAGKNLLIEKIVHYLRYAVHLPTCSSMGLTE